eukprot:COSAG06_NODE_66375_length_254_cov_1.000000_1_plen_84_part_11
MGSSYLLLAVELRKAGAPRAMADGSYAPLATSGGDAENPTTAVVGRADRRPLLGGDGAVPAPADTSALASGADPPTPGGSDPEG